MNFKSKKNKASNIGAKSILIGVFVSVIVSLIGTALITFLLGQGSVDESVARVCMKLVSFLSAFFGCLICVSQVDDKIMLFAGICSGIYLFLLAAVNILIFEGKFDGVFVTLVLVLLASSVSAFIRVKKLQGKGSIKFRFK